jgi:hypothetical protein
VIVRFDLERDREAVADVDGAGVLARPEEDVGAFGGKPAKLPLQMIIVQLNGPHQREHRQLEVVRVAAEHRQDQLVLHVGESEIAVAAPVAVVARQRRGRQRAL